jgi:RimJ/RimL family protein N-acetyltransferase
MHISDVTDETAEIWREIHNLVIPASPLSAEDVGERRQRHLLTVARVGGKTVGNATIRPPEDKSGTVTVIVRILPAYRNQGFGTSYLEAMLDRARSIGAAQIETVVLSANEEGLRFAQRHGFTELERYVVDGAEYVDLVLA